MKNAAVSSILFAGLALAVPAVQKRDIATQVVTTTVWTTTTQYVLPSSAGAANAFFEKGGQSPAAAAPTTTPAAAPAPAAAPTPAAAAPVVQQAQAQPAQAAPAPAAAAPAAAAPASGGGAALASGTGQGTWYDVSVGLTSCGGSHSNSEAVVALSLALMTSKNTSGNPNSNPLCGKTVTITYKGKSTTATVVDSCAGCALGDIDMTQSLFNTALPGGDGRVDGVSWVVN